MKQKTKKEFFTAACLLLAFALWTVLLRRVDVQEIGPRGSAVGFATLNGAFHALTGANMKLYVITDWLGLVPVATAPAFAVLGLVQWIQRRSLLKVDRDLFALGGFYLAVMGVYVLFECVVINRRPVLIDGFLEASYPSSTTLLVLCVMPTTMMQLWARIKRTALRRVLLIALLAFTAFMVVGRLLCGVHWLTDIIGGALLSAGLVTLYHSFATLPET